MSKFKFGQPCRSKCGASARYFGDGMCLFISGQGHDFYIGTAVQSCVTEGVPLPSDDALRGARAAYSAVLFRDALAKMPELTNENQ